MHTAYVFTTSQLCIRRILCQGALQLEHLNIRQVQTCYHDALNHHTESGCRVRQSYLGSKVWEAVQPSVSHASYAHDNLLNQHNRRLVKKAGRQATKQLAWTIGGKAGGRGAGQHSAGQVAI